MTQNAATPLCGILAAAGTRRPSGTATMASTPASRAAARSTAMHGVVRFTIVPPTSGRAYRWFRGCSSRSPAHAAAIREGRQLFAQRQRCPPATHRVTYSTAVNSLLVSPAPRPRRRSRPFVGQYGDMSTHRHWGASANATGDRKTDSRINIPARRRVVSRTTQPGRRQHTVSSAPGNRL